jgi:hypothetical protein
MHRSLGDPRPGLLGTGAQGMITVFVVLFAIIFGLAVIYWLMSWWGGDD